MDVPVHEPALRRAFALVLRLARDAQVTIRGNELGRVGSQVRLGVISLFVIPFIRARLWPCFAMVISPERLLLPPLFLVLVPLSGIFQLRQTGYAVLLCLGCLPRVEELPQSPACHV